MEETFDESQKSLTYFPCLRRSTRKNDDVPLDRLRFANVCLVTEVLLTDNNLDAPFRYDEAIISRNCHKWTNAMEEEMK